jgi:predicted nuclease of predicted toxin-antitoxin system
MKRYESEDTTSKQLKEICFFLDRTIDNPTVLNGLRELGFKVIPHRDKFKHNEKDHIWIEYVAKKNWVIITHDKAIKRRALEIKAVVIYKARMLCMTNGNMDKPAQLDVLTKGMKKIRNYIKQNEPPYIVRLHRGTGKKPQITLNALELPPIKDLISK